MAFRYMLMHSYQASLPEYLLWGFFSRNIDWASRNIPRLVVPLGFTSPLPHYFHSVPVNTNTGAVQKEPQVITGEAGSATGSCAVDVWLCIWVPSPASQFSCWWLHSFCFWVCINLMLARGYRPVLVLYWTWQTYLYINNLFFTQNPGLEKMLSPAIWTKDLNSFNMEKTVSSELK